MKIKNSKLKTNRAFTLIELLVVIAIISLVSAVLFSNGRTFSDKLDVSTSAQDISLAIRDVQSYGSSVSEVSSGTGQFGYGYGIVFDKTHPKYAILFVDTNGDKQYTSTGGCGVSGDECIKQLILRNGVNIQSLCGVKSSGAPVCDATVQSVAMTFLRPSLDATITLLNPSGIVLSGPWVSGSVVLTSVQGNTKTVSVGSTGQVSVQ